MAKEGLREQIEKRVAREKGFIKVGDGGSIPVLIDARYASKGEAYLDRSLYMLAVSFVLDDNPNKPPTVEFNGLSFVQRFAPDRWVSREYLDKLIEDKNGLYIPPKMP
jgi:hypothetical protein